jgi:hypothetical protein
LKHHREGELFVEVLPGLEAVMEPTEEAVEEVALSGVVKVSVFASTPLSERVSGTGEDQGAPLSVASRSLPSCGCRTELLAPWIRVTWWRDLMSAVEMSRAEVVALVQRIMEADYTSDDEVDDWLDRLDRVLACPPGHVSDLIFWPPERRLSADEVVDQALGYRPIAL